MTTMPERTATTPAELAEHAARLERARTGTARRTLHALCRQAARMVECRECGARPGRACDGWAGYHLGRFARAALAGLMDAGEFTVVLGGLDVFTGSTVIRDGAR